jgi:hypothetical protein
MINCKRWSSSGLIWSTIQTFAWKDWGKERKASATVTGFRTEISTADPVNAKQGAYLFRKRHSPTVFLSNGHSATEGKEIKCGNRRNISRLAIASHIKRLLRKTMNTAVTFSWPFSTICAVDLVKSTNWDEDSRATLINRVLVTVRHSAFSHNAAATTTPLFFATLLFTREPEARSKISASISKKYTVVYLLKARTVEWEKQPLLGNGSGTTFVSTQRLGKHVPAATDTHATTEVQLETVFSTRLVWRRGRIPPP